MSRPRQVFLTEFTELIEWKSDRLILIIMLILSKR